MSLPKPYYQDDAVIIYHADCRDILPDLPKADLLLTDPPYQLGEDGWAGGYGWGRFNHHTPDWDRRVDMKTMTGLVSTAQSAIIWGGNYYGLPESRCWLVWDKMQSFSGAEAELAWTNLEMPTKVFRLSRVEAYANGKQHPTEKPTALFLWCLSFVSSHLILDPFLGSGTTAFAAKKLGRKCIGIEIEEKYCEIAAKRCAQEVMALDTDSSEQPVETQGELG